jgi:hypothetical protein
MAKKLEPAKPIRWAIYKLAAKAVGLGSVEASERLGIKLASAGRARSGPL